MRNKLILRQPTKRVSVLVDLVAYGFILLFLYAAVTKLIDYQKFSIQIAQSPILTNFSSILAWLIPAIEVIIAFLLFFHRTLLPGLYASFSLMVMFTGYIAAILLFAERIPCSCGGILEKMNWTQHLIFNAATVFVACSAIIIHSKLSSLKKQ